MSRWERTGQRNLALSQWHREVFDDDAKAFDLDLVGIDHRCDQPLYVIEGTSGQSHKSTGWTQKVALMLNVPAFLVHYSVDDADRLGELDAFVLAPFQGRRRLGDAFEFAEHLRELRRHHAATWHPSPRPANQARLFTPNGPAA